MLHPLVLIVVIALIGRDLIAAPPALALGPASATAAVLGAHGAIAVIAHVLLVLAGRRLDRTGVAGVIARADRTLALSRAATGVVFLGAVFGLGWVSVVRAAVGDWVLLDEGLAITPPIVVFAAGWWSFEPIERRLHDAVTLRALDRCAPIHAFPSRWSFTWERLRSTALGALAPILMILAWSEGVSIAASRSGALGRGGETAEALALAGAQLVGAGLVLAVSPPIIVRIWGAARLENGPVRDRVRALCRQTGARVGGVRVWRTRGVVLNAAVLGLVPGSRTLLLTDALIERLAAGQLDAVILHEIAHVRRRHLPWLIGALLVAFTGALVIADVAAAAIGVGANAPAPVWAEAVAIGASSSVAVWVFGRVSRLFERQADAFAAATLTRAEGASRITPDAAEAMASALERVARLNHIPPGKFMWRHGSIAGRRRRLRELVGEPVSALPADRRARRAKTGIALTAGLVALGVLLTAARPSADAPDPAPDTPATEPADP